MRKLVQLEVWVHYDSSDGYVWPQVYPTRSAAELDEKLNAPVKALRLLSEPYMSEGVKRGVSGSFGTEIPYRARRGKPMPMADEEEG
jgi:hypothetical protein